MLNSDDYIKSSRELHLLFVNSLGIDFVVRYPNIIDTLYCTYNEELELYRRGALEASCDVGGLSARPEKIKKQFFKYDEYTSLT